MSSQVKGLILVSTYLTVIYAQSPTQFITFSASLLCIPILLQTLWSAYLHQSLPARMQNILPPTQIDMAIDPSSPAFLDACQKHSYTTEIISLDPLMIYINNFTSAAEAEALIDLGSEDFEDSFISLSTGTTRKAPGRTSQSAPLEPSHPLVACVLARARTFLGTMLQPAEPFSMPQLVRYFPGQRYDLHTDFWPRHQMLSDGSARFFNRPASFFVFLRGNCTEGETWFPAVDVLDTDDEGGLEGLFKGKVFRGGGPSREGTKDGEKGVRFKPLRGNAVFWVNLGRNGVGDRRVVHAGLPVGEGEKIGMNIWPRKYFYGEE